MQDLLSDGGGEGSAPQVEIEHSMLGEDSVPDVVLTHVLEASRSTDTDSVLAPLEDGDLYYGFRLQGADLGFTVILRLQDNVVVGIETFDLRFPTDPITNERSGPEPTEAEQAHQRNAILDEVRTKFDRALKSDYRGVDDLLIWAPPMLPTIGFKRAMDLVAEAVSTRPPATDNVVRLVTNNIGRVWRQPALTTPWVPVVRASESPHTQPTVLRTGDAGVFSAFVEFARGMLSDEKDQERLAESVR